MKKIKIPAFGEECFQAAENKTACVSFIKDAKEDVFYNYCLHFEQNGFEKKEEFQRVGHSYAAFTDGSTSLFLNYYSKIRELYITEDCNTLYFSHQNSPDTQITVTPRITQIDLADFGLSYAIRLSDGRFIIFDGGSDFDPDHDALLRCLKAGTHAGKPRIAAWIFTHPHRDHFECFVGFMKKYADEVEIDAFYYNFPEHDDIEHFPALATASKNFDYDSSPFNYIQLMEELIQKTGAPVYTPHTGQRYVIGDAALEILSSMDDIMHCANSINPISLVVRMELGGQVILWTADASCGASRLAEKHGEYLKSDILQIPHHGFGCGSAEAEIAVYDLTCPKVCFLPVSTYNAYTTFSTFKESSRYIMSAHYVEEIIAGDPERTITLPYEPPKNAKKALEAQVLSGIDNCGSKTWIFTDLSTAKEEDFVFTFLNMTQHETATVMIELFFKEKTNRIRYIKAEIAPGTLNTLNIVGDEVDADSVYYNTYSLKAHGIPENQSFAVRFMSNVPIVISHPKHAPAHYTPNR